MAFPARSQTPAPRTAAGAASRRTRAARGAVLAGVLGLATTLASTLAPGTAVAAPEQAGSAEEATRLGAGATHQLEVVTEQVNDAQVVLAEQQAAAAAAAQTVADTQAQLQSLGAQMDEVAVSAFTGNPSGFAALLTSSSPEDFIAEVGTIDVIARHTTDLLAQVSGAAQAAVDTAMDQRGDPYVWEAGGPGSFDCSGLTAYTYAAAGISLPHSSAAQARMGSPVARGELQPGDLVYSSSPISHIGIHIGDGMMVHAPTSGDVVEVSSVDMSGYAGARRLL